MSRVPPRQRAAIILLGILLVLGACAASREPASIQAYGAIEEPVIVRVAWGSETHDRLLEVEQIGFVYKGDEMPSDLTVRFLDRDTCAVIGEVGDLPRLARAYLELSPDGRFVRARVDDDHPGQGGGLLPLDETCRGH